MNESPNSDDSIPSLSSYPPAFVSLITTFIKRAEEAETRAHKALVILKAKDDQVVQLQQRMEVLEKIAYRLEEVMVPPLDLPKSPQSLGGIGSPHPRDVNNKSAKIPIETLYERYKKSPQEKESFCNQDPHNCYEKCQFLIDGLERSNCQLREALAAEGQQRVKDHEQYVATLSKMTKAFKDLQDKQRQPTEENHNIPDKIHPGVPTDTSDIILNKTSDSKSSDCLRHGQLDIIDHSKKDVGLAESIISILQYRLQKRKNKNRLINKMNNIKGKNSEKLVYNVLSKRSMSSQHSPKSCSSLKVKRGSHISSHSFLRSLQKQNKKLKEKYHHICEKFTESVTLGEKLQKDLVSLSNKKTAESKVDKTRTQTQSTQTIDTLSLLNNHQEKTQPSRSSSIMQGRLDAAAKVMAKQCKQIQDLQNQLRESFSQVDSLKKRLARAEANAAGKEALEETIKRQLEDSEKRNLALNQELQQIRDCCSHLRQELSLKTEECNKIKTEKEAYELEFNEIKTSLETKLLTLSTALQQKEQINEDVASELQTKLSNLREHFITQVTEASDRLVAADFKIQELYLGIETFLKLLFTLNSPEMSPSSQEQAVQVASEILQLTPVEVQSILHSSRCDLRVSRWIRECNNMVHEKVFAKNLGNLLLDAVLEAKVA